MGTTGTLLLPQPQYVHQKVPIENSRASALGSFQIRPRPSSRPTWKCFVPRPLHQGPRSLAIALWFRRPQLELDCEIGCVGWMWETMHFWHEYFRYMCEWYWRFSGAHHFPSTWRNSPEASWNQFSSGFLQAIWRPTGDPFDHSFKTAARMT